MRFLRVVVTLPILYLSLLNGCSCNSIPQKTSVDNAAAKGEGSAPSKPRRAIVFVHGIHGSSADTWLASGASQDWPAMMQADGRFADAAILKIGFPTPYTGNKNGAKDIANSLSEQFKPIFMQYDQVIFVCHSLGGLIVKEVLLSHPEFASKVPMVVFYATPHGGSVIAQYGSVILDDPLLDVMKGEGGDTYIFKLAQRWRDAKLQLHSYCVYENKRMKPHDLVSIVFGVTPANAPKLADFVGGVFVVSAFSATYGCDNNGQDYDRVDANHLEIVKPPAPGVGAYELFSKYYAGSPFPPQPIDQVITYDKVICATYGEANQGQPAWNNDFQCPVPDAKHLDRGYRQPAGTSGFAGGGASTDMGTANVPPAFDVIADGAYYWSVRAPSFDGNTFTLHTYCGPSGGYAGGCNVKARIIAHYRVNVTQEAK